VGQVIDKAAASALMMADDAINKAAASAQMLADKATDMAINASALIQLGGEFGGHPYHPSLQKPIDEINGYP
jgi:hypothetical protein